MIKHRLFRKMILGFVILALTVTSFGGAFAAAASAAVPDETQEETLGAEEKADGGKAAAIGLAAIGLLAVLAGGGDDDKPASPAPSKPAPAPAPSVPSAPAPAPSTGVSGVTADEVKAFNLLNADRAAKGLPPLRLNSRLVILARNYAQDMINRGFFAHNDPDGRTPFDRMRAAGISYRYAGENLAINRSVAGAEQAFMNSPGHRANILNPNYTEVGIGVRYSGSSVYVVQEFIGR